MFHVVGERKHALVSVWFAAVVLSTCLASGRAMADWTQIGLDFEGQVMNDGLGNAVSVSADGRRLAIGVLGPNSRAGEVRVYDWNGSAWVQVGNAIVGEAAMDTSGSAVALSADGMRLAIGAPENDGSGAEAGHVRVFDWNGMAWVQAGSDIDGEAAGDRSGAAIALSANGLRLAIGATANSGNGVDAGHVRVYEWIGGDWQQAGQDIEGVAEEGLGFSVDLSATGNRLGIGVPGELFVSAGTARVYDWNGSAWVQAGPDINGEAVGDVSAVSLDLSADGQRLAIGAPGNDGNGDASGSVRVYAWNGTDWSQVGADIDGESAGDLSGIKVGLSADGRRIAVGATGNDGNGDGAGHVRTYEWRDNAWIQTGSDIDGAAPSDEEGRVFALSGDGTRLALGVGRHNSFAGKVRVFSFADQRGNDINGEIGEASSLSVSLSGGGTRVAFGAPLSSDNGASAGQTRVFDWTGSAWIQAGSDINGEAPMDLSGRAVTLSSNGLRLAVGAAQNGGAGAGAGHVRVFQWSGSDWQQVGSDIDGEMAGHGSGFAVALSSNGSRLATGEIGGGGGAGQVRVFDLSNGNWIQAGDALVGETAEDLSGLAVALSADGQRLAIGAPGNDGAGDNAGHVRVYDWNGSAWTQTGDDVDGEAAGDQSGFAVALSADGARLAVGAFENGGAGSQAGHVRVYEWDGMDWMQVGLDIDGQAPGNQSGQSVALSADGTRLAVGEPASIRNGIDSGEVSVYDWNGTAWVRLRQEFLGEAGADFMGWSVDLSADGGTLAAGAFTSEMDEAGYVRVYALPISSEVSVTLSDTLVGDVGSNGRVDPGDTVGYSLVLIPTGGTDARDVGMSFAPGANSRIVPGSVTTTLGSVTDGNAGGDSTVAVAVGAPTLGVPVTIDFDVQIDDPFPIEATRVAAQALVTIPGQSSVLSDDPDSAAAADETTTIVFGPLVFRDGFEN